MKKILVWCGLFVKRQLKRPSMIFTLLFMIIMSAALRIMSMDVTASIQVGFYINEDSEIANSLTSHEGMIKFISYDSKDALEADVKAGSLQCGYVFSEDFHDSIISGQYKKVIELIEPPENITSLLSNVIILATVMENMASHMLVEDAVSQDFFDNISDREFEALIETYNLYASNGSTFSFDYNALYEEYTGSSKTINIFSYLVTPVKGIVAIFVFITSLTGGVSWFKDNKSFAYGNISINKRPALKLLVIATPTIMAATAGYTSLIVAGISDNPLRELYVMAVYSLLCIVFSYVLTAIVGENLFLALIPVFILGSVVCSPIFFNLANLIPAMKILQNLFMPSIYFML